MIALDILIDSHPNRLKKISLIFILVMIELTKNAFYDDASHYLPKTVLY